MDDVSMNLLRSKPHLEHQDSEENIILRLPRLFSGWNEKFTIHKFSGEKVQM